MARIRAPVWWPGGRPNIFLKGNDMIVVSGEALMDVFVTRHTSSGLSLDARVGGSPLNVAIGLARLGQRAAFFGALSQDFLGDRLMQALADEGVAIDCVARMDAPTTLSLVSLDSAGGPTYAFYGDGAADRRLPLDTLSQVPPAQVFHFGSYSMVVEPLATTLRALIERECQRSVIAYDPNIRLNVEPDIRRWQQALQWMLPRTALIKISDEDLALLCPGRTVDDLAREWLAAGVALVVVTRGAHGAWAWTAAHHVAIAAMPITVVDAVGAGDTFQAALLTALRERQLLTRTALAWLSRTDLEAALNFATRAAAITCSRRGADLPRRAELP